MDYEGLVERLGQLRDGSVDPDALTEAMDIVSDYGKMAAQMSGMLQRYEIAADAVGRGMGIYQCPDCGERVFFDNEHCKKCGRRLRWETRRTDRNGIRKNGHPERRKRKNA